VPLMQADRHRHVYLIGMTGTGKTGLLLNMMHADLMAGAGFCFVDPHGDAWPVVRDVFEMILATPAPLPLALAAPVRGDRSGYATRAAIEQVADLMIFEDDQVRFFHATLAEFLSSPASPYYVAARQGASRLARFALDDRNREQLTAAQAQFCDRQLHGWLDQADGLAEIAAGLPAFYERTRFGRPAAATGALLSAVSTEIDPVEERVAVRLATAAPDVALEIIGQAALRGGERLRAAGMAPWVRETGLAPPAEAERQAIAAQILVAFDLAGMALGWARAIGAARPELRDRLVATLRKGAVLKYGLGWFEFASGCQVLGLSGYYEDMAYILYKGFPAG